MPRFTSCFLAVVCLCAAWLGGMRLVQAEGAAAPEARAAGAADAPTGEVAGFAGPSGRDVPMVDSALQAPAPARYGVGIRSRVTSVPKWLLGAFFDQSVPLTSYTIGIEGYRRSGNFDFVLGLAWQSLSPSDGNWLGQGHPPATDTDFVQFRDLGAVSLDAAFIFHSAFNRYVGMHYGGGVGLGIITGKLLRTSDGSPGCPANPGSAGDCFPVVCPTGPCTEAELKATESPLGVDSATTPSRFRQTLPSVYPIVNLVTGLDFQTPRLPAVDFKIDVGYFFPYFFLGGGISYRI
jgi:hypothetical protein